MSDLAAQPAENGDLNLRLSALCAKRVIDTEGNDHGSVLDVRVVRDGPTNVSGDAALRIDGLVVGHKGWVEHIGLFRHTVHGPWLLEAIGRRVTPRRSYLPWNQLDDPRHFASAGPVRFTGQLSDLPDIDGTVA